MVDVSLAVEEDMNNPQTLSWDAKDGHAEKFMAHPALTAQTPIAPADDEAPQPKEKLTLDIDASPKGDPEKPSLETTEKEVERAGPEQVQKTKQQDENAYVENGSKTYCDGSTYEGSLQGGKRHGHGIWVSASGIMYDGQWQDDRFQGGGRQTWQDGRSFEGSYVRGKFEGHGRMEWNDPKGKVVYEGQYVNGLKDGKGKFMWPDGRVYDGEWAEGKRNGAGLYISAKGEKKRGIWQNDKLESWVDAPDGQSEQMLGA